MGKFKEEIEPVEVVKRAAGQEVARESVTQDEGINPGLTVQKAALYPTVFKKGGSVTPANACPTPADVRHAAAPRAAPHPPASARCRGQEL